MHRLLVVLFFLGLLGPSVAQDSTQIVDISRKFLGALELAEYWNVQKYMDKAIKEKMPKGTVQAVWEGLAKQMGPFQDYTRIWLEGTDTSKTVFMTCQFEKGSLDQQLTFDQGAKIIGWFFAPSAPEEGAQYSSPAYVNKAAFQEKEVALQSGKYKLAGKVCLANEAKNLPAVVLVHGSGPQDMDVSIGPNKIFADLAHGIASQGVAVFRYDKRTKMYGQEMVAQMDSLTVNEETIDDAVAAIKWLKQQPEVDKNKVFVLGHSLGGYLVPRIAAEEIVAGAVIMAGNTRPLEDLVLEQSEYLLALDTLTASEEQQLSLLELQVQTVKGPGLNEQTPRSMLPLGLPASYWLDLKNYDPLASASKLNCPILIMQGERDYQVTMEDFNLWKLELSQQENIELQSYPDLNHLFIEGKQKSVPDEYSKPGNVAPYVIHDLAKWIKAR